MYISNGIAYAGEQEPIIKVCGVRPLPGHRLWLRFTTGEAKVFDFTPLLKDAGFAPLADEHTFAGVKTRTPGGSSTGSPLLSLP